MKNALRIFKRDLKKVLTNWVALVVVIALIILPALYAWFNVKAMWDPYGNTRGIKIAVVNEDIGASLDGKEINVGEEIVKKLEENENIGWQFVDREDAQEGVRTGKYYASMIVPEDFSNKLLSITENRIIEPTLEYTVNEKSNSVAPKITDKGVGTVKDQVSEQVVETVDGIIFSVLNKIGVEVTNSKPEIRKLIDVIYKLDEEMPQIEELINKAYDGTITVDEMVNKINGLMPTIEDTINTSQDVLGTSKEYLDKAKASLTQLSPVIKQDLIVGENVVGGINSLLQSIDENTSPEKVKEVLTAIKGKVEGLNNSVESLIKLLKSINNLIHNKDLDNAIGNLTKIKDEVDKVLDLINTGIESGNNEAFKDKFKDLQERVERIDSILTSILDNYDGKIVPALNTGIAQLTKIADNTSMLMNEAEKSIPDLKDILALIGEGSKLGNEKLGVLKEKMPTYKEKLHGYVEKIKDLDDEEKIDKILDLITGDANAQSKFLSSPIQVNETKVFPIPNYGSGMSPFFSALSMWIGAVLLLSLFTTHAKDFEDGTQLKPYEEYLGKYLFFLTMGVLQSVVITLGDIFILKAYVVHPILFVVYGAFISIVFVTIVYTLVSLFRNVGKALAVILLVLQIAASGGTYPIEVMPEFFQSIHPLLPFKYAIGGLREAVGGIVPELLSRDTIVLAGFFLVFLVIGVLGKKYLNKGLDKFSRKLEESEIVGH